MLSYFPRPMMPSLMNADSVDAPACEEPVPAFCGWGFCGLSVAGLVGRGHETTDQGWFRAASLPSRHLCDYPPGFRYQPESGGNSVINQGEGELTHPGGQ